MRLAPHPRNPVSAAKGGRGEAAEPKPTEATSNQLTSGRVLLDERGAKAQVQARHRAEKLCALLMAALHGALELLEREELEEQGGEEHLV